MAQHDYVIDNQSFPATRTDLNNVLQAIVSNNSGTSAPSTTFANQLFYNSSTNVLSIRNEDNDAFIPLMQFDQSADVAATLATVIDILDASGTDQAGTALTIRAGAGTGTGAGGSIIFQTADGGSSGSSVNSHATVVTVTDDGKVGVGVAAPDALLHVQDTVASTATHSYTKLHIEDADHLALQFSGGTSGESWIFFADDTTSTPVGGITYFHGGPYMGFRVEGSERLRILSGGGLTFNGDTATANALDDYEEGDWTPVYQGLSSNPTVTHSVQIGRYVKVGQFVNVMFRIQTTAASGGSGALLIGGLPFACTNVSSLFATGSVGFSSGFTTFAPQTLLVTANGQTIQLIRNSGTNGYDGLATSITTSELSNASGANDCIGSISYRTD